MGGYRTYVSNLIEVLSMKTRVTDPGPREVTSDINWMLSCIDLRDIEHALRGSSMARAPFARFKRQ